MPGKSYNRHRYLGFLNLGGSPMLTGYLALGAALVMIATSGILKRFDLWVLDHQFTALRALRQIQPSQDVALIGIDDETAHDFVEPMALWHRHYAQTLNALSALAPAAVGLDIVLPDRSYDAVAPGYDRDLVRGLVHGRSRFPLVIGITVNSSGNPRPLLGVIESAVGPGGTGFVLVPVDVDGAVRRFDERIAIDGGIVPTLAGQIARKLGRDPGFGIIDFSQGLALDYIPMQDLLAAARSGQLDRYRSQISGKVVLFGPLMQFEDRKRQPINLARWESDRTDAPGMLLHAQALRSILGKGLIQPLPVWTSLTLAGLVALVWFVPLTTVRGGVLLGTGILALTGLSLFLLDRQIFLASGLALTGLVGAISARGAYQGAQSGRQRRHLRAALQGYVSPQVAKDVLSGRLAAGFSGRRYTLCVMFVDMRDFTPRSEKMAPEALIQLLNACFEELVDSTHRYDGTVVQFTGDGLMALFGAPNALSNPARAGFDAARDMLRRIELLNVRLAADNNEPVQIGIGLNLGEAVVGHVGARSRYGYSAMGDTVNVASRLEGLTKEVGFPLVVSDGIELALGHEAGLVPLGKKAIKGHSAVKVFGWRPDDHAKSGSSFNGPRL